MSDKRVHHLRNVHLRKLTNEQVALIRSGKHTVKDLIQICGVSEGTILRVRNNESYKEQ